MIVSCMVLLFLMMRLLFRLFRRRGSWVPSVMCSLLFDWLYEVDIVRSLTFFVIEARSNLRTVFRLTVSVLQAPVANLKVTPLRIPLLFVIFIADSMECLMVSISPIVGIHAVA